MGLYPLPMSVSQVGTRSPLTAASARGTQQKSLCLAWVCYSALDGPNDNCPEKIPMET